MTGAPARVADFRARPLPVAAERLDGLVGVVDPLGRLGLAVALVLIVAAIGWSLLGSVPVSVAGQGLLLPRNAASLDIRAPKGGWLRQTAPLNARVARGQTIAVIEPVEANGQRRDAETRLRQLQAQRDSAAALYARRLAAERTLAATRRGTLSALAASSRREVGLAERGLARSEELIRRGLTTVDRLDAAQQRLYALREPLARTLSDIAGLDEPALALAGERDGALRALDTAIADLRAQIRELDLAIGLAARIVSPRDGFVVARFANEGQLVEAQQPLLIVQSGDPALQATVFIPVEQGKRVRPGMEARVSVSTAAPEVYGAIKGDVVWVSAAPRGEAELAKTLGQPDLARQFARGGAPIEVHVRLRRDSASANGYAWSSRLGRDIALSRGMVVRSTVVVKREPPLALAVPALRGLFGPS